jgi:hypothetical protein
MFPAVYHQADDTTSVVLFSSNDTKNWARVPGPDMLDTANFGAWDGGVVFAQPNLVELPDGSWVLPYSGYTLPHKYPRGSWSLDIGLAVWPKGRLVAVEAADLGNFSTVGFLSPGSRIFINAVTARAGEVLIEACDINGKPLPGHSFDDAIPVIGDQYCQPIKWRNAEGLGVEKGQPIMLRFRLNRAKIFGVDFE